MLYIFYNIKEKIIEQLLLLFWFIYIVFYLRRWLNESYKTKSRIIES
jgi:hypothetical protein